MPSANRSDLLHSISLGMVNAIFEMKLQGQRILSHALQDPQDQRLLYFAAGNHLIAVFTILQYQIVGFNGFPKGNVIERFKPGFNILDIFKNYHADSLPNSEWFKQIFLRRQGIM